MRSDSSVTAYECRTIEMNRQTHTHNTHTYASPSFHFLEIFSSTCAQSWLTIIPQGPRCHPLEKKSSHPHCFITYHDLFSSSSCHSVITCWCICLLGYLCLPHWHVSFTEMGICTFYSLRYSYLLESNKWPLNICWLDKYLVFIWAYCFIHWFS